MQAIVIACDRLAGDTADRSKQDVEVSAWRRFVRCATMMGVIESWSHHALHCNHCSREYVCKQSKRGWSLVKGLDRSGAM